MGKILSSSVPGHGPNSLPAARIPVSSTLRTIGVMKISARNQLKGTIESIVLGVVTAKVSVRVGDNLIESVITRQSVEELNLQVGDTVTAVIKSTEIMLMTD
jgi:molybdopterin-binding protein